MATNTLSQEQDRVVREFYITVVGDDTQWPGDEVGQAKAAQMCRRLLNYTVVDGKHVSADLDLSYKFGTPRVVEDEWASDTGAVANEADQDSGTDEADSSESPEDTEVREAILPEDV